MVLLISVIFQVRKACRLYAENASQRFNVLVKAFCAKDKTTAVDSILEAKSLLTAGARLLLSIKDKEVSEDKLSN